MTHMDAWDGVSLKWFVEIFTLLLAVVTHTAVLFRWGGKVNALLEGHERRLARIENLQDRRLPR